MYPTDLSDSAWQVIKEILADKRKRRYSLRSILNALFYVAKTGCQWRQLPKDLPPWQLCYYYFWKWRNDGTWERVNRTLVSMVRQKAGRKASPSVGVIDSQSVKNSERGVQHKGFDGNKRIQGRKRHIVVDSLGLVLVVVVHAANLHDGPAARQVIARLAAQGYERMEMLLGDSAYGGKLREWAMQAYRLVVAVVRVCDLPGFHAVPMRWKVERTFAWMGWSRRLGKDYECDCSSHEAFVYIFNIYRMLKHF